jgi:hypothetical protein
MHTMKKNFGEITKFIFFIFFYFFLFDLLIGNYVYKKILRKNYFDVEHNMGKKHSIYHHALKKNFSTNSAGWGKKRFSFCTDNHSFRIECGSKQTGKFFDIGIIGDSFTVGFGLSYKEMFVTKISKKLKNKKIANLAASSYAPSIYYSKINYLLDNGFKFNEIIVFLDLSDLHDDTIKYELLENKVLGKDNDFNVENYSLSEKFLQFLSRNFKVTNFLVIQTNEFLIKKKIKDRTIPHWVLQNPRSSWTYNYDKKYYLNKNLEDVIKNSKFNMQQLYDLLKKNNIELSIAVFPWPSTLKFDEENNLHLNIWKNFCITRCKNFFNMMSPFFEAKNKMKFNKLYFKYYIDGDIHFNETGNDVLSETFLSLYKE